jgi:RNA-directed DNA polymerase
MSKSCYRKDKDIFNAGNIRNCEKYTLAIQRKLDRAVVGNDNDSIREIFNLLTRKSNAVKTLATWRITQRNAGKYTAGVDDIKIPYGTRAEQNAVRLSLLDEIDIQRKPDNIRRTFIEKSNGKKRPLGIPTLRDRIVQEILRIAIDPIVEYHFNDNSYGFRPKRSCQDAQRLLHMKLGKPNSPRYVLEGDIKGCFDNINHEHIIKTLREWSVPKWATKTIEQMLKSGIFYNGEVYDNDTGTPQGGVISPMLANVALTTLDEFCFEKYGYTSKNSKSDRVYSTNPIVRYADDFVIVCKSEPQTKQIKGEIAQHLKEVVGLSLSEEKTHITHIHKGFNFLGFNIRKHHIGNGKQGIPKGKKQRMNDYGKHGDYELLIKPQKEKAQKLLQSCKEELEKRLTLTQDEILRILNPKIRGWGMYYRFAVSKQTFSKVDWLLWRKLYNWAKRRHPKKTKSWIINRYFHKVGGRKHIFKDQDTGIEIYRLADIPITRFVKINTTNRVYDTNPDTIEYWEKREHVNAYKQIESVRIGQLYQKQHGKCPYCNSRISEHDIAETQVHVHHMRPRSSGGKDGYNNLRLLHSDCHRELHANYSRKLMTELTDKGIDYIRYKGVGSELQS